jgi:hypothetical protein
MDEVKKWIHELVICTIVAGVATLFTYLLGLEKSWQEAAETFIIAFVVMFALGLYNRKKNKK